MRIQRIQRSRKLGFNMIPMIDVVFLLIIFFLVSSHLARYEAEQLDLPKAVSGDRDEFTGASRLTVNVRDDGSMILAGRPLSTHRLTERFQAARQEFGDEVEVRIRCSRRTPYQHVSPIMLACTRVGIWNVTYSVYHQEGD